MAGLTIQFPKTDGDAISVTGATYELQVMGDDTNSNFKLDPDKCTLFQDNVQLNVKKTVGPASIRPWAVQFHDVPVSTTAKYKIHIQDDQGGKEERTFKFANRTACVEKLFSVLQQPNSPHSGDTVNSSPGFYVSGQSDPQVPIYASIAQQGGKAYYGSMMFLPPNYGFLFQNVPPGANYIAVVTEWSSPPQTVTVTNITVI